MPFDSIPELLDEIRAGRMVVVLDDEDRENEGDLIMAASKVRPEDVNFMAREARGLICLALTRERCRQLALPPVVGFQVHSGPVQMIGPNRTLVIGSLQELSDRSIQERLWCSLGAPEVSSLEEAVERLFTDSGLGMLLEKRQSGYGGDTEYALAVLRTQVRKINARRSPSAIIDDPEMVRCGFRACRATIPP